MRPYETIVVLRTDLAEEDSNKLLARFENVIASEGGAMDERRDWGVRDLAYLIAKQKQGHYYLLEYQAEPTVVKELERTMRIVEGVLRYVTVQQEHTGLPEPRVRESYDRDRRDTPLSEMRSSGRDDSASNETEAPVAAPAQEKTREAEPQAAVESESVAPVEAEPATEVQS